MTGKRIFLTGGTGYLGLHIIQSYYNDNEITIFSRDETKQAFLRAKYPKLKFVIGDVRNLPLMRAAAVGHNIGIFCASLKHVGFVNANVEEAVRIIIDGSINAKAVSLESGFEAACMVSTDKSRLPITLYGAMKFIAGEQFIWDAERHVTRMSTAVCGNIINSTGSVIPLIWKAIHDKRPITLYSERMTRFVITGDGAATLVDEALKTTAHSIVPKLKSFYVKDLFELYRERFGLRFAVTPAANSIERDHECMVSKEDAIRTASRGNYFHIHYCREFERPTLVNGEYCSADCAMEKDELDEFLSNHNWYQ